MLLFNHNASFPLMTCSILGNGSNNSMHSEFSFFSFFFFFFYCSQKNKSGSCGVRYCGEGIRFLLFLLCYPKPLTALSVVRAWCCGIDVLWGHCGIWDGLAQVTSEGTTWWLPHSPLPRLLSWGSTPPPPPWSSTPPPTHGLAGGGEPSTFSISPPQGLLFFLSCLLGSSSSLFFLQKGRKANLEHTQLTCHRGWLAQRLALAPWQLKGAGRPAQGQPREQGKGGRRRDAYLPRPGGRGPILLPPLLLPGDPWPQRQASGPRPAAGRLHALSTPSSYWMREEAAALRRESLHQQRSRLQPWGRQKQEEGESIFHFGPKTIVRLLEKSAVFFHPGLRGVGSFLTEAFSGLDVRVSDEMMLSSVCGGWWVPCGEVGN